MKRTAQIVAVTLCTIGAAYTQTAFADSTLLGYNTSGTVFQIDPKTGALTQKAAEELHSFSLGAIARRKSKLYYVSAPSGTTENSIFTADTQSGTISHVDIDKADDSDEVVDLFFSGNKLLGIFYSGSTGALLINRIDPTTGATTLVKDFTSLDIEPVPGAISRIGKFVFILAKPSSDSSRRQLVRYRVPSGTIKTFDIQTKGPTPTNVLCDRIKLIRDSLTFLCLASSSDTQVDVFRVNQNGKAKFLSTLSGISRIAGGHTLVTPNEKAFYAFVYATGESNNQRLLKISALGQLKSNALINTLIVGARFGAEEPETE